MKDFSKYFIIQELVCPEILDVLGELGAKQLVQPWVSRLDTLREAIGRKMFCNTQANIYRGIRPIGCRVGAKHSRHKRLDPSVAAFDLSCHKMDELDRLIEKNWKDLGIVRMEEPSHTKTWRHIEFLAEGLTPQKFSLFIP